MLFNKPSIIILNKHFQLHFDKNFEIFINKLMKNKIILNLQLKLDYLLIEIIIRLENGGIVKKFKIQGESFVTFIVDVLS